MNIIENVWNFNDGNEAKKKNLKFAKVMLGHAYNPNQIDSKSMN